MVIYKQFLSHILFVRSRFVSHTVSSISRNIIYKTTSLNISRFYFTKVRMSDFEVEAQLASLSINDKPNNESKPTNVVAKESTENTSQTSKTPATKMAVYYHPSCSLHRIPDHPECHSRVDGIMATLRKNMSDRLIFKEAKRVTEKEILLFHTPGLIQRFQKLADKAIQSYQKKKTVDYLSIDMDTTVMWQTRPAAFYAAGSVISALDSMYADIDSSERIDTAFCCVRPPGHHAERNTAGGFCFLNNVGIGARYAQKTYGVERVAILDFDVHHGNGTEEGFTSDPSVFYGSTHGKDHFPGTGHDPSPLVGDKATKELDRRIVNRLLTPGPESRVEFKIKWCEILSEMERFQPELVIMSTGFDAHDDDPLADCELQDEDYHWVTAQILASCGRITAALSRPVRYLSVLEGGYDICAIQRSALCHVEAMLEGVPNVPVQSAVAGSTSAPPTASELLKDDGAHSLEMTSGGNATSAQTGTESAAIGATGAGECPDSRSDQTVPALPTPTPTTTTAVSTELVSGKVDGELAALAEYLRDCGVHLDDK